MKRHLSIALASVLAVSGASAAFAGSMSHHHASNTMRSDRMEHATTGLAAQGQLTLSTQQKQKLWSDLSASSTAQTAPAHFSAKVGEAVPSGVNPQPLPSQAATDVPTVKNYNYAMLQNEIVLVNPDTHKIAGVIRQRS